MNFERVAPPGAIPRSMHLLRRELTFHCVPRSPKWLKTAEISSVDFHTCLVSSKSQCEYEKN